MVGLIESLDHVTRGTFTEPGDAIVLLGESTGELGGSEYLARIHGVVAGAPPACDLDGERRLIDAVLTAIGRDAVRSAHDVSDGGLAVALAECCVGDITRVVGADIDLSPTQIVWRALLFGEGQGRIVVSSPDPAVVLAVASEAGVPARVIGTVQPESGGLVIRGSRGVELRVTVEALVRAYHDAIPSIMSGSVAAAAVAEEPLTTV
jgi:phosphoribosylformylglycinamidine synthase